MSKNRYIFSNPILLDSFISDLLYPAILGSLIYDFTRFEFIREYWFLSITLVFYVIDYFYMHYTFEKYKKRHDPTTIRTSSMMIYDFLVAVSFMLIIYSLHKSYFIIILLLTILIFFIAYIYDTNSKASSKVLKRLIICAIFIVIIQQLIANQLANASIVILQQLAHSFNNLLEAITYLALVILYAVAACKDYYIDSNTNKQA